jgi:hypothetical protein
MVSHLEATNCGALKKRKLVKYLKKASQTANFASSKFY